jgi:tetratricopeptide (TPR) repeat protein
VGRFRPALLAFRRALSLDPRHGQAREEFWKVHVALDFNQLARDPELLALVDFKLCVERAGTLLMEAPTQKNLSDALRLLDMVLSLKPALRPAVDYWRAVALTHERKIDQAADLLANLLDPDKHARGDAYRRSVLMQAWQLALTLHDELRRRVGQPQLALPGRRMEAIAAVERHWAEVPDDQTVWPLKRLLYQDLAEAEFERALNEGKPPELFDYGYSQQLGAALIEDPTRWPRGAEYLRMAARGMLSHAPTLYTQVAQAYERAGNRELMFQSYALAKKAGLAMQHPNLADQEKQTFFRAVKLLGEEAMARGDLDAAIDNFHLYGEYDHSGVETLRTLAELYERKGDALAAARITDRALVYNSKDKDLLERKDRYYYSTSPELLRANLEAAGPELDLNYCQTKAKSVLDQAEVDFDSLDWAEHLINLALVVKPQNRPFRVLKARAQWKRGEVEQAASILEAVRTPKPEKFATADDEEAWYVACQLLGDLYLNNLARPQDAIACLNDYRKSPRSGARTYYRLGQAYEQLGDTARAVKCYQQVAAYDGNPLQYEAQEALSRLGSPG